MFLLHEDWHEAKTKEYTEKKGDFLLFPSSPVPSLVSFISKDKTQDQHRVRSLLDCGLFPSRQLSYYIHLFQSRHLSFQPHVTVL